MNEINEHRDIQNVNNETLNKLTEFIFEQGFGYTLPFPLLWKKKKITRETEVENDLGIYGDDADEFLIDFGKEFSVDVSQFPIGEYFSDEGDFILPAIIRSFTNTKKRGRKSFTVGHLEKAIFSGKLDADTMLD